MFVPPVQPPITTHIYQDVVPVLHSDFSVKQLGFVYSFVRRLLDFVLGLAGLIFSAPIIMFAVIAIRVESPGNPFFIQERVGLGGRLFKIFKLRGMYIDSKQRFPELYDYSKHHDLHFFYHRVNDPRVTKVGAFMRRTSIDELLNFANVVRGDMTLVGPRPEIPEVFALYGPSAVKYVSVKPGITCLSKITGRDRLTKEETVNVDLDYLRCMNLWLDLKILWVTFIQAILRRDVTL